VDDWKEGILAEASIAISWKDFEERCDVVEETLYVVVVVVNFFKF